MSFSIKDHPFYQRMRQRSPEIAGGLIGDDAIEEAPDATRKLTFRSVAKDIMFGRAERNGFPSNTNGEIAMRHGAGVQGWSSAGC